MPPDQSAPNKLPGIPSSATVIAFHKVLSRFTYGVTNYAPRRLHRLLSALIKCGFSLWHRDLAADSAVVLSFDDGYAHLQNILPSLAAEFHTTPVVFVPTNWIGKTNRWDYSHSLQKLPHLSTGQIRDLHASGVSFASHGVGHCDLTALPDDRLRDELVGSRETLEDIVGVPIHAISYPFGRANDRVAAAASEVGYTNGYTMHLPSANDPPLLTGRIPVYSFDSVGAVRRRLRRCSGIGWEKFKVQFAHRLSGGTVMLNRLRRM